MVEEIDLEKCNFLNFRSPVTLTLDRVIRHTVVHQSLTSMHIPNCGQMDVHTDIPTDRQTFPPLMLLGRLGRVDLKRAKDEEVNGQWGKWVPQAHSETIHAQIFDTMQSEMVTIVKLTSVATDSWAVELFNKQVIYISLN